MHRKWLCSYTRICRREYMCGKPVYNVGSVANIFLRNNSNRYYIRFCLVLIYHFRVLYFLSKIHFLQTQHTQTNLSPPFHKRGQKMKTSCIFVLFLYFLDSTNACPIQITIPATTYSEDGKTSNISFALMYVNSDISKNQVLDYYIGSLQIEVVALPVCDCNQINIIIRLNKTTTLNLNTNNTHDCADFSIPSSICMNFYCVDALLLKPIATITSDIQTCQTTSTFRFTLFSFDMDSRSINYVYLVTVFIGIVFSVLVFFTRKAIWKVCKI